MKRKLMIVSGIVGLVILGLVVYGLFRLPYWAVLTWAILATLLLPVVGLGAWWFGRYESAALLKGIDKGIGQVAQAATKLKVREPRVQNVAVLPQLPPVVHRQLIGGKEEVVDL